MRSVAIAQVLCPQKLYKSFLMILENWGGPTVRRMKTSVISKVSLTAFELVNFQNQCALLDLM